MQTFEHTRLQTSLLRIVINVVTFLRVEKLPDSPDLIAACALPSSVTKNENYNRHYILI